MKKGILLFMSLCFLTFNGIAQSITDIDGNTYDTLTIGTQTWMKENLRTTKFNDGIAISVTTSGTEWESLTTPSYCNYNNTDNADTINNYGRLYNWYAVETNRLCPTGWKVPTNDEWMTLFKFLDNAAVVQSEGGTVSTLADNMLNDTSSSYWDCMDQITNSSGFSVRPAGYRTDEGKYITLGSLANVWANSTNDNESSWKYDMSCTEIYKSSYSKQSGFSVRCIKGNSTRLKLVKPLNINVIYPNPASDKLYVQNELSNEISSISVYSTSGVLISQQDLQMGENQINISELNEGVYIIAIQNKHGITNHKFIKE